MEEIVVAVLGRAYIRIWKEGEASVWEDWVIWDSLLLNRQAANRI